VSINDNEAKIEAGSKKKTEDTQTSSNRLNSMLAESAAFRRYYQSADKDRLVIFNNES
jgi:hypothetical protein